MCRGSFGFPWGRFEVSCVSPKWHYGGISVPVVCLWVLSRERRESEREEREIEGEREDKEEREIREREKKGGRGRGRDRRETAR